MKKRVLIFSTAYFPLVGGAEVAIKEITDRLQDHYEFVMITAKIKKNLSSYEKVGNIEVHRLGRGSYLDKFYLFFVGASKAKKLGKFDLVWAIMASYAGLAALRFKKRNQKIPFLLTLQEGDSKQHIYKHVWFIWPYFKQIFKKANQIQAISNYLARWAISLGSKVNPMVVPNGVDLTKFYLPAADFDKNSVRSELGISRDSKVVVTSSRLVPKNGLEDLVKALALLPKNSHLIILGAGPLQKLIAARAYALKLTNRVHFLGYVNHTQMIKYLWASDVFCRPSLSEGLGVSFLEAMATGLPVVATNVGGIPDFLTDKVTGLFCSAEDEKDIAYKINMFFADKVFAKKIGQNGHNLIQDRYSWDIVTDKMKDVFWLMNVN